MIGYRFTDEDLVTIKDIGDGRYASNRKIGTINQQIADQPSTQIERCGVAAELAIANILSGTWNKDLGHPDPQYGDVVVGDITVSVKASLHPHAQWVLMGNQLLVKDDYLMFCVPMNDRLGMHWVGWLPKVEFNTLIEPVAKRGMKPGTRGVHIDHLLSASMFIPELRPQKTYTGQ
jgi:hypothetical protein